MPRKTLLLIAILAAVTLVLVYLAMTGMGVRQPSSTQRDVVTRAPVAKTAKVMFSPATLDLSTTTASSVDVLVDSGGADISGVQVELQYDPRALTQVALTPSVDAASFFGTSANVLFNDVKTETGRVSFAIAISQGQSGKKGVGKIGTLTFTKLAGAPRTTVVEFLDKTLVTVLGENESALKETVPLNITLSTQVIPTQSFAPSTPVNPPASTQ